MPASSTQYTFKAIYLIGFMATGKSHWGMAWAKRHHLRFIDLDLEIETQESAPIPIIFEMKGEDYFRLRERDMLRQMPASNCIVACGGGAACFFDNMEWMNANGTTILLEGSAAFIVKNIMKQKGRRPLVKQLDETELLLFVEQKLKERQPFYSQARITVQSEAATAATIDFLLK